MEAFAPIQYSKNCLRIEIQGRVMYFYVDEFLNT